MAAAALAVAALAVAGFGLAGAARAQTVVARWIQLGPGSSRDALNAGKYGDQPLSTTPTILARAVVSDGVCPAISIDGGRPAAMTLRVSAAQLTDTPTARSNYPAFFADPAVTSPVNFPDGTARVTTSWAACESVVPAGHTTATIGGVALKLPIANPKRILVIGDTGCRMNGNAPSQQNCHDPVAFPFGPLANYEALFKPDLVVHVGDYFYRDTNCLSNGTEFVPGCNTPDSPNYQTWGDTWDSWNADFFYPGNTLLAAAPWVMTRANHETCNRGQRGWFALLDPRPWGTPLPPKSTTAAGTTVTTATDPATLTSSSFVNCAASSGGAANAPVAAGPVYSGDFLPTYIVPFGGLNLLVHDSSFANDGAVDANMARNFDYEMTAVLNALPPNSRNIVVTHKPMFGMVAGATTDGGNFTQQYAYLGAPTGAASAFSAGVPVKIPFFLAGHIHAFQYVNFADNVTYAPQLVVGNSGDNLDPPLNPDRVTPTFGYSDKNFTVHNATASTTTAVVRAFSQTKFGFAIMDATPAGFNVDVYNVSSTKAGRCTITLSPRNIACWQ